MSHGPYVVQNVAVDIKVDEQGLRDVMVLYIKALGANFEKFFKRQARLLCQDMLDYTVPYDPDPPTSGSRAGRNALARKRGIESMEADIDRVFQPLARAGWGDISEVDSFGIFNAWVIARKDAGYSVPKSFEDGMGSESDWRSFKSLWQGRSDGRFFAEEQIPDYSTVYGGSSIEAKHLEIRGGTRVPDYKKPMQDCMFVHLVADYAQVQRYKARVAKRVGTLKAGWYSAGMAIGDGAISAPLWIVGNQWGSGIMVNQLNERPYLSITVGNRDHHLMSVNPGSHEWSNALSHRAYSIRNELARRLSNRNGETVEEATQALLATGHFEISSAENTPF